MKNPIVIHFVTACCFALGALQGQSIRIHPTSTIAYPMPIVDGNSPGVWVDGTLHVYTSTGDPLAMTGADLFNLRQSASPVVTPRDHYPIWIESAWRDEDGTIYAWYHHEPGGVCPKNSLTAPKIGALVSTDGGVTFTDLGIVLATGDPLNCNAENGFFAGGHGDFSVILDQDRRYFYFLFGNYSGPPEHQGVAIARMPFENRADPVGFVNKYYVGRVDRTRHRRARYPNIPGRGLVGTLQHGRLVGTGDPLEHLSQVLCSRAQPYLLQARMATGGHLSFDHYRS